MTIAASVATYMQMQKNKEQPKKSVKKHSRRHHNLRYQQNTNLQQSKPFNFLEYAKNNPEFLIGLVPDSFTLKSKKKVQIKQKSLQ